MEEITGSIDSTSLNKREALAVLFLFETGERLMNAALGNDGQRRCLRSRVIRETFRELQKTRKKTKKYIKRVLRSRKAAKDCSWAIMLVRRELALQGYLLAMLCDEKHIDVDRDFEADFARVVCSNLFVERE